MHPLKFKYVSTSPKKCENLCKIHQTGGLSIHAASDLTITLRNLNSLIFVYFKIVRGANLFCNKAMRARALKL